MEGTTAFLAGKLGVQPQSLRSAVCRTGSYFGITPLKLPNGRLLWPADAFDRIVAAGSQK